MPSNLESPQNGEVPAAGDSTKRNIDAGTLDKRP